jgi:hypothetical protein
MILLDHLQLCLDNIKNLKPYSNILLLGDFNAHFNIENPVHVKRIWITIM